MKQRIHKSFKIFDKKKVTSILFIVSLLVTTVIYCATMYFFLNQWRGTFKGDLKVFLIPLYLNDYAELDSTIIFIVFLHKHLLVYKISNVRTVALSHPSFYAHADTVSEIQ